MFKKAFTLAEVLIVVAIIGAVSALTIPNISDSYKEDNTIVKIKKLKNELDSAQKQALLRYGEYNNWFKSSVSASDRNAAEAERLLEFMEVAQSNLTFPINDCTSTTVELKDGTWICVNCSSGNCGVFVATDGPKSTVKGKNIFRFDSSYTYGTVTPYHGSSDDRGSGNVLNISDNIAGTNWAITNENLDYLRCKTSLNWENKTSCN